MVLSTLLDPSLLIADEITSALDVSTQRAVAEMLVEFRDRAFVKSTIVITHDLSILYQIADTILIMYAGKLVEKASGDGDHRGPAASVHAASARVAPRGRSALQRAPAEGHSRPAAVAPQPADRVQVPRQVPARLREVRRGAAVRRGRAGTARRLLEGDRLMLQLDDVTKVFRVGTFGGAAITAVSRRHVRGQARRGRFPDRRERQRQDHGRPHDPALDGGHGRDDHVRRRGRDGARAAVGSAATTSTSRASSRIPSARTTPCSGSTGCSR